MEQKIDEIAFAEKEHEGKQHKFAERPTVCYACHEQQSVHEHNERALKSYSPDRNNPWI